MTGLLGLRVVLPCGRKGLRNAFGFAFGLHFYVKGKQIWLQKSSSSSPSFPPLQEKAKLCQVKGEILRLAHLTAQISSERNAPPVGEGQELLRLPLQPCLQRHYMATVSSPVFSRTKHLSPTSQGSGLPLFHLITPSLAQERRERSLEEAEVFVPC